MKMLMAIVDNRRKEELELVLQKEGVHGWTEIPHVRGLGSTGPRLDSAAYPESSAIIHVLVENADADGLLRPVSAAHQTSPLGCYCGDVGLRQG
jgi:nitrogen regulatory protein PII